ASRIPPVRVPPTPDIEGHARCRARRVAVRGQAWGRARPSGCILVVLVAPTAAAIRLADAPARPPRGRDAPLPSALRVGCEIVATDATAAGNGRSGGACPLRHVSIHQPDEPAAALAAQLGRLVCARAQRRVIASDRTAPTDSKMELRLSNHPDRRGRDDLTAFGAAVAVLGRAPLGHVVTA